MIQDPASFSLPALQRLAVTPGEPAGIGPDLCVRLAARPFPAQLVVIGDPDLLAARARQLGQEIHLRPFVPEAPRQAKPAGILQVLARPLRTPAVAGRLDPANAAYVLDTLALACDGCLAGDFDALVTGPVHKGLLNQAGYPFTGHTEFLAERCAATDPVMLLAVPGLRVALATTHLPLSQVASHITGSLVERILRVLERELREKFALTRPRILVCGLNPHAGEGGHLGTEEETLLRPLIEDLRAQGLAVTGPVPADTAFLPARLAQCDAVLAMYHDQGLPVLKHLGFGHAVNITLGLPILRTSVDHGTALELAGTGAADDRSLDAALVLAREMAERRSSRSTQPGASPPA